jgi:hypothetical protein
MNIAITRWPPSAVVDNQVRITLTSATQFTIDIMSTHLSYILSTAHQRTAHPIIEPTAAAQEEWANRIASMAIAGAAMVGCTPSYLNNEGALDKIPPEAQLKAARQGIWAKGVEDFERVLKEWRADGALKGLEIRSKDAGAVA